MSFGFLSTPVWFSSAAALGASFTWAASSLLFARAARTLGALRVNLLRLLIATVLVLIAHRILEGQFLATQLGSEAILYFVASGVVGLALGDLCYFHSIAVLGPRKGSLLMATAPIQAGILGFVMLGEHLSLLAWGGILANVGGVCLVLADRQTTGAWDVEVRPAAKRVALVAGLFGGLGQALGLVLAKKGLDLSADAHGNPLNAHAIRMIAGLLPVLAWTLLKKRPAPVPPAHRKAAMTALCIGSFLGPSLGVWLSLVALQSKSTGVAAALLSLAPIMVIPMVRFSHGERVGVYGILGALLATFGTILLLV